MVESNRQTQSLALQPRPNNGDHDFVLQPLERPMAIYLHPDQVVPILRIDGHFRKLQLSHKNKLN